MSAIPEKHLEFCRAVAALASDAGVSQLSLTFFPGIRDEWRDEIKMQWEQGRHGEDSRRQGMEFNINEKVRVRLTDHGRAVHAADHALFWASVNHPNPLAYTPPKEDENGWSEWQLWTLIEAFGKHIHLGGKNCFETTIELVTPNVQVVRPAACGRSEPTQGSASPSCAD